MTAWVTCSGASPASAVTLASADHCRRVTVGAEAEPGGGFGEALVKRTVMTGGDLTEVGPAGHQIVGAGAQPPRHDQPSDHPPVLQRQGALGCQRQAAPIPRHRRG